MNTRPLPSPSVKFSSVPGVYLLVLTASGPKQLSITPLKLSMSKRAEIEPSKSTSRSPLMVSMFSRPERFSSAWNTISPEMVCSLARSNRLSTRVRSPLTELAVISPARFCASTSPLTELSSDTISLSSPCNSTSPLTVSISTSDAAASLSMSPLTELRRCAPSKSRTSMSALTPDTLIMLFSGTRISRSVEILRW